MKLFQNKKSVALYFLSIIFIFVFFYSFPTASAITYPIKGWRISTPEEQGMQSQVLAEMIEHIKNNSYHIDSILIIRNGYLILDAYFWPYSKGQKHIIHSCTKSIMSALIGIAIDKGYIQNVNQPITDFFPDKTFADKDSLKKSITLKNLLTMASGLKCRDSYRYGWTGLNEMRISKDWAEYVLALPMAEPPGEKFEYCNGVSYLLSVIIQKATNMRTLEFAKKNLFGPLGITDVRWQTSPQGIDIGWGRMWLKPHDMAKIGWLYLNNGRWGNKQIVSTMWVEASTRKQIDATVVELLQISDVFDHYGYQWWVDFDGYYAAVGYKGQGIYVVPEKNIVAVFTGDMLGKSALIVKNLFDSYIIPAAVSPKPLPFNPEEKARLDDLQASISKAPAKGFIWTLEKEGVAKDGVFKRTASPGFQFEYPPASKKSATDAPGQVMRMKAPGDVFFSASVGDIPQSVKLEDFGPMGYAPLLNNLGSNIKVISNEEITLKCGTKAYRTDIIWLLYNYLPLTTLLVTAHKDGKIIFVSAHQWKNTNIAEPIVQSLIVK